MGIHTIASTIVGSMQKWERKPADYYPTPYNATQVILDFLDLPPGTIVWEPAAGDGDMAAVMEVNGLDVRASDLRRTGYVEGGVNFLTADLTHKPEWIITNPPFKVATEFIGHALSITPNVAMLLKSQFWHAAGRVELFERHPPAYVCPLTWRPSFLEKERGKSPLMDVIWVIWRGRTNVTEYRPLRKPCAQRMESIKHKADILLSRNEIADFEDILGSSMPVSSTESGGFIDVLGE
ncbi:putative DNA methyltransferase protein [Rhizobium phage RHph_X2_30]|nr:putative DNA methyltransferase protein [Rhizobium phage RHph_X2_30]